MLGECGWAGCMRLASCVMELSRPCGHAGLELSYGSILTCPGHAEAFAGEEAPRSSLCSVCGQENHVRATPRVETTVLVHPESVNLADVKARAAELGATVVASVYVPLGAMFVVAPGALDLLPQRRRLK